ncbi:uncharacterized protein V6R79_000606 [Siganus canaliculatus]
MKLFYSRRLRMSRTRRRSIVIVSERMRSTSAAASSCQGVSAVLSAVKWFHRSKRRDGNVTEGGFLKKENVVYTFLT